MSIRFHCTCGRHFNVPDDAAGRKAKCLSCGKVLTVPHPRTGASGAGPQHPPAPPRPPRPPEPDDIPVARVVDEDAVPMARLVETARKHHIHTAPLRRRSPGPGPAKVVLGICVVVGFVLAMDVIITLGMGVRRRGGVPSTGWWHAAWLACLVVGFFLAAAGARGSRFCLGLLIGGAVRGVINGVLILVFVLLGEKLWVAWPKWMMFYGVAALAVACVYLVCLLVAAETRRYLAGHGGTVAGAAVMGAILGGLVVPTAQPGPLFLLTATLARPQEAPRIAAALDAPELLGEEGRERIANEMKRKMNRIAEAMQAYIDSHVGHLPDDLGELVGLKDCKAEDFLAPGSTRPLPKRDPKTGAFQGPTDFILVLGGYHQYDLPENPDEAGLMIVCHSDPNCHFGAGAVVLRPFNSPGPLVGWLNKAHLADELNETRRWMKRNPPRPRVKAAGGAK